MDWTEEIDARGLRCPLPVLRAQKVMRALAPGTIVRLRTTDPMAAIDVPHFCAEAGHELLWSGEEVGANAFLLKRGPERTRE